MVLKRVVLASAAVLGACLFASAASAATTITTVDTGNSNNAGLVNIANYGSPWTTPILLTDSTGKTYVVFCVDLEHDITVSGGQSLPFTLGLIEDDGFGNLLGTKGLGGASAYTQQQINTAEAISNELGQLATIGRIDYAKNDLAGADAAQAAIWSLEYAQYGYTVTVTDPTVNADFQQDIKVRNNGGGWAEGILFTDGKTQDQVIGLPEPSTWAMLILGVAMTGFALRRRAVAGQVAA